MSNCAYVSDLIKALEDFKQIHGDLPLATRSTSTRAVRVDTYITGENGSDRVYCVVGPPDYHYA